MKIFQLFFTLFIVHFSFIISRCQAPPCFTDQLWARMVQNDSSLLYQRQAADRAISQLSNNNVSSQHIASRSASNPTIIPTVIYIVNDGTAASNISMQQIQSQMDQLNATYSNYGYQFCLAKRGTPDTSTFVPQAGDSAGVFRISNGLTNVDIYTQDAALKALSPLPSQNYCRIFVVNSITPVGVLGYAYFPGTSIQEDGIVVLASVFGSNNYCPSCSLMASYNLGAVLIHEAGHFLNLYHTFQGGCYETTVNTLDACQVYGDYVCDTPPTDGSFGCPSPAPVSCDNVNPELIQDYMDYTTDPCKDEFTPGQNSRMDYSVLAYRSVLVSTQNLINTGITCASLGGLYATFNCTNYNGCLSDTMTFTSLNSNGFTYHWNFGDGDTATGVNGYHAYSSTGQFLVTLTAVNTSQNISESSSTPVFITECHPIACGYDKWEFEFGELDFSSGQPVATNHAVMVGYDGAAFFPAFYGGLARGDSTGKPLFYFNSSYSCDLFDASRTYIDSMGYSAYWRLCIPSPGHTDRYCLVRVGFDSDNSYYNIIDASNGAITFPYGETGTAIPPQTSHPIETIGAVPNCDGTEFWVLIYTLYGMFSEYKLSQDVLTFQANYTFPGVYGGNIVVSPDGKTVSLNSCEYNGVLSSVLYNFNKSTGALTQKLVMTDTLTTVPNNPQSDWTVGFSPNSRFLYKQEPCCFTSGTALYNVYQYDMYNPDPAGTRVNILQFPESYPGPLYLDFKNGPDKKTYFGYEASTPGNSPRNYRLGVINYPNVLADNNNSIGLNVNGPYIIPPNCPYPGVNDQGFTGFTDACDAFDCSWQPGVPQPFTYFASGCKSYQFYSDDCFTHLWNFGDVQSGAGDTSTNNYPVHVFSAPGSYTVTLNANGYIFTDTINITAPLLQLAGSGLSLCPTIHGNYSVATVQPGVNYTWNVTNGTPPFATLVNNIDVQWNNGPDTTGLVQVIAVNNSTGCTDTASLAVSWSGLAGQPVLNLNANLCGSQGGYSFYGRTLDTPGNYSDTVQNGSGCDSIINLHLTVNTAFTSSMNATICSGDSFSFNHVMLYSPGVFMDTVHAVDGCDSVVTLHLNVYPVASVSIIVNGDTLSTSGFTSYQWYLGDSAIIHATGSIYIAGKTGNYYVAATDSNGCQATSAAIFVATGIPGLAADESFVNIFPNPNSVDNWQLTVDPEYSGLVGSALEVFDDEGRLIFKSAIRDLKSEITLDVASGVYYLRISTTSGTVIKKLIKL